MVYSLNFDFINVFISHFSIRKSGKSRRLRSINYFGESIRIGYNIICIGIPISNYTKQLLMPTLRFPFCLLTSITSTTLLVVFFRIFSFKLDSWRLNKYPTRLRMSINPILGNSRRSKGIKKKKSSSWSRL